ncbi:hypothetical protein [Salinigranum salinum]|nr:hypothetical protein [Salinigranum salinum]
MKKRPLTWLRDGAPTEQLRRQWTTLDRGWKAAVLGVLIVVVHLL